MAGLYYGRSTGDSYRRCIYRCVGRGALRAVDMGWSVLSASRSSCCLRVLKGRGVGLGVGQGSRAGEQGRGAGRGVERGVGCEAGRGVGSSSFSPTGPPTRRSRWAPLVPSDKDGPQQSGAAPGAAGGRAALKAQSGWPCGGCGRVRRFSSDDAALQADLLVELREGRHHRLGRLHVEGHLLDIFPWVVALGRLPASRYRTAAVF